MRLKQRAKRVCDLTVSASRVPSLDPYRRLEVSDEDGGATVTHDPRHMLFQAADQDERKLDLAAGALALQNGQHRRHRLILDADHERGVIDAQEPARRADASNAMALVPERRNDLFRIQVVDDGHK